jgi:sialidase-1
LVVHDRELNLNEGSIVELPDGTLVDYMREDTQMEYAYKCISTDGGRNWSGPFRTRMRSCVGRPKAGLLQTGEVAVTYGFSLFPRNLMLYIESVSLAAAQSEDKPVAGIEYMKERSISFPVDYDRSVFCDGAYSGWVNLPNGDIYVVQYIVDDAPMAQIRGYRISRGDYILGAPSSPLPAWTYEERIKAQEPYYGNEQYASPYHDFYVDKIAEAFQKNSVCGK